jgi:hypothetical protein
MLNEFLFCAILNVAVVIFNTVAAVFEDVSACVKVMKYVARGLIKGSYFRWIERDCRRKFCNCNGKVLQQGRVGFVDLI